MVWLHLMIFFTKFAPTAIGSKLKLADINVESSVGYSRISKTGSKLLMFKWTVLSKKYVKYDPRQKQFDYNLVITTVKGYVPLCLTYRRSFRKIIFNLDLQVLPESITRLIRKLLP